MKNKLFLLEDGHIIEFSYVDYKDDSYVDCYSMNGKDFIPARGILLIFPYAVMGEDGYRRVCIPLDYNSHRLMLEEVEL